MAPERESRSTRHHLIIAGTGRAGTSLLVKILNACGLETELSRGNGYFWDDCANAGIETVPLAGREHPYVLKSPWTYQFLDELLYRKNVRIDGLIVPVCDLREAAASRIIIELQNMHNSAPDPDELLPGRRNWGLTPGGVTYSLEPIDQARILGQSLHLLLEKALELEIPICLIKFPKFARDPMYLYRNLAGFISSRVDRAQFEAIFRSIVSAEQIRVSSELAEAADSPAVISTAAHSTIQLPSLENLENIALRRELRTKRLEIAEASTEISRLTARCSKLEEELAATTPEGSLPRSEREEAGEVAPTLKGSNPGRVQDKPPAVGPRTSLSDAVAMISPASFWVPEYICPSAWIEHAPFAFWLCDALRPRRFVELGTHHGYSYFAFCQAIGRLGLGTTAYAVDTWKGDEHAGFYDESVFQSVAKRNKEKYSAFSCLMRTTFEDALGYFADGSVDLLHIDGRHFYDDIKQDFTMWRPKLTEDAIVLLHDTNVREREFGVWKFFEETGAEHPYFQFFHSNGLGVLTLGDRVPAPLARLLQASCETADQIRAVYAALGGALTPRRALGAKTDAIAFLLNKEAEGSSPDAETVARISDWEDQVQQVSRALEARVSAVEQLRAEIEQRAATEAALRAEVEQRAATEAALRADIEQRAATEASLRSALQKAERDAETRDARAEAVKAEIAVIQDVLSKTDRNLQERAAAAEALQAELKLARNNLAEAEHRESTHHSALTTLRAEISSVRIEFEEAERRRREGEAAAAARQAEITSLRIELAAARDVGKAALALLRITPAPILPSARDTGWLGVMLRRFGRSVNYPLPSAG
jgi:hypothetical protein